MGQWGPPPPYHAGAPHGGMGAMGGMGGMGMGMPPGRAYVPPGYNGVRASRLV